MGTMTASVSSRRRATSRSSCQTPSLPSRRSAGEHPFSSSRVRLLCPCDSHHVLPLQPNSGQSTSQFRTEAREGVAHTCSLPCCAQIHDVACEQTRFHGDV